MIEHRLRWGGLSNTNTSCVRWVRLFQQILRKQMRRLYFRRALSENVCAICYEDILNFPIDTLICGHAFHMSCIDFWTHTCLEESLDPACPLCRSSYLNK